MTGISRPTFEVIAADEALASVLARARQAARDAGFTREERAARAREDAAAEMVREAESAARLRLARLAAAGVPRKHVAVLTSGGYDKTAFTARVAVRWRSSAHHTLVLSGHIGIGKSLAACWLLDQGPRSMFRTPDGAETARWPDELGPRYIHASRLARLSMFGSSGEMDRLESCALLVVDEVGGAEGGPNWVARLDALVCVRADNELDTVLTTNLTLAEFAAKYGERALDRMRGDGRCWVESTEETSRRDGPRWAEDRG